MRANNFAWLCEVKNTSAPIFAWSCEINFEISLWFVAKNTFWSISYDCAKFSHGHAKWKYIIFQLFFCHFFHFFLLNPLQSPPNQFQIPVQTNYITFVIMHLDLHQLYLFSSIWLISFVTNLSKSYLEMSPKLHKTC